MAGLLFILSAPSGSGKSTLVSQLRSMVPNLDFSSRGPPARRAARNSKAANITSSIAGEFERMIAADDFLEHADVFGNYYGTARTSLGEALERGNDLLLDIDVQGAAQVRRNMPQAVSIFILPPNPDVLASALRNRSRAEGGVRGMVVQKRLATARLEIEQYHEYRYVLVNDVLDRAAEELSAIVMAERSYEQAAQNARQPEDPELEHQAWLDNAYWKIPPTGCDRFWRLSVSRCKLELLGNSLRLHQKQQPAHPHLQEVASWKNLLLQKANTERST